MKFREPPPGVNLYAWTLQEAARIRRERIGDMTAIRRIERVASMREAARDYDKQQHESWGD